MLSSLWAIKSRCRWASVALLLLSTIWPTTPFAANGSVAYTYDALGRLVTANYDTGVCIAYTYDANGNRLSEKILVTPPGNTGVWGCFNWNSAKWGP